MGVCACAHTRVGAERCRGTWWVCRRVVPGFILLANMTGDHSMRAAAVAVADTLAAQVRPAPLSNGTRSPWPFRVHAKTGAVEEQYTSNVVSALLVFDQIGRTWAPPDTPIALVGGGSLPRLEAYARASAIARDWQQQYPEVNGRWTACCEDVPIDNGTLTNFNSIQSLFAAQYVPSLAAVRPLAAPLC